MCAPLVLRGLAVLFMPRPGCRRDGAFVYATAGPRPGASDKGASAAPGEQGVSCGQPPLPASGSLRRAGRMEETAQQAFSNPRRAGKQSAAPLRRADFRTIFFRVITPLDSCNFSGVRARFSHGARNTKTRRQRHRHQALFYALFQKSRLFLPSVPCYKSICCRVLPICPGRKAKGGKPLLVAVTNTRHRFS